MSTHGHENLGQDLGQLMLTKRQLLRALGLGAAGTGLAALGAGCGSPEDGGGDVTPTQTGGNTTANPMTSPETLAINDLLRPLASGLARGIIEAYDPDATGDHTLRSMPAIDNQVQYDGSFGFGDPNARLAYRANLVTNPNTGAVSRVSYFHLGPTGEVNRDGNPLYAGKIVTLMSDRLGNWTGIWESRRYVEVNGLRSEISAERLILDARPENPAGVNDARQITQAPVRPQIDALASTVLGYFQPQPAL